MLNDRSFSDVDCRMLAFSVCGLVIAWSLGGVAMLAAAYTAVLDLWVVDYVLPDASKFLFEKVLCRPSAVWLLLGLVKGNNTLSSCACCVVIT